MYVHCRTNLDLNNETWPDEMPAVPNVGDHIQSATKWDIFQLTLKVVRITWKQINDRYPNSNSNTGVYWYPEIELHMTNFHSQLPCSKGPDCKGSIRAFYEWYAPLIGRRVSDFI